MNLKSSKRSRLAPLGFKSKENCVMIGDKYIKYLLTTALPRVFGVGLLSRYVSNPSVKVFMVTEKLDMDCASMLKKDYRDKEEQYRKTHDPSERQKLEFDLRSLNTYIREITANSDSTMNVTLIFSIQSDTEKELHEITRNLKLNLETEGFKVTYANLIQENLLRYATPLFTHSKLPKVVEENLGVPLPAAGTAGLYPFIFETLKDPQGFILGEELGNKGIICWDQFFYINNEKEARQSNRVNGNIVVVGGSGFGKTTALKLLIRSYIRQKKKLIWIDPENKNRKLTKRYGGTFVDWGKKGNIINIFDLKPISVEDDEDASIMWHTDQAIYNVIEDIKVVLKYLKPSISDDTLTMVSEVTKRTYEKAGYDFNGSFRGKTKEDSPTFQDFYDNLVEIMQEYSDDPSQKKRVELLGDLQLKVEPLLNEYSIYFNGKTTIDAGGGSRGIISFGTKVLFERAENLKNALNHIMYQFAWSLCLDEREDSAFVIDEAHVDIRTEISAAMLEQFVRRSRKYNNVCAIATQEPKDFAMDHLLTQGKAIFSNSVYKLFLHLEQDPVEELSKLTKINNSEAEMIQSFKMGDALFVCGDKKIPIHILPTENELKEMA